MHQWILCTLGLSLLALLWSDSKGFYLRSFSISGELNDDQRPFPIKPILERRSDSPWPLLLHVNNSRDLLLSELRSHQLTTIHSFIHTAPILALGGGTLYSNQSVLAAVTQDDRLTIFNEHLTKLWSGSIDSQCIQDYQKRRHHESHFYTPEHLFPVVSIAVSPSRIYETDAGLILVSVQCGLNGGASAFLAAFEAQSGYMRWNWIEKSNQPEKESVPWWKYRQDVLSVLPVSYSHPWDLKMNLNSFKSIENFPTGLPNVASLFLGDRVIFVHLFTGRFITQLGPLSFYATYTQLAPKSKRLTKASVYEGPPVRRFAGLKQTQRITDSCVGELATATELGLPLHSSQNRDIIFSFEACSEPSGNLWRRLTAATTFGAKDGVASWLKQLDGKDASPNTRSISLMIPPLPVQLSDQSLLVYTTHNGVLTAVNPLTQKPHWRVRVPVGYGRMRRLMHQPQLERFLNAFRNKRQGSFLSFYYVGATPYETQKPSTGSSMTELILIVGDGSVSWIDPRTGHLHFRQSLLKKEALAPPVMLNGNEQNNGRALLLTNRGFLVFQISKQNPLGPVAAFALLVVLLCILCFRGFQQFLWKLDESEKETTEDLNRFI